MLEKQCVDHLGNTFPSVKEMCKYWGVNSTTFNSRIKRSGCSLEEALTTPVKVKCNKCTDHLGNEFPSKKAMCEYWGISNITFHARIRYGYTLEEALTISIKPNHNVCVDHLGNEFLSVTKMCEYWNIDRNSFCYRINRGLSVEEALTTPLRDCYVIDHLGNKYSSLGKMCKAWGIDRTTYLCRLERGCDMETALTSDLQRSFLEMSVGRYLSSQNVTFVQEYVLADCKFEKTGWSARFDFYIPNFGFIEVDGKQHFEEFPHFGGHKKLKETHTRDIYKDNYCEKHNIPLLRIHYNQISDGTYKDMIDDFISNPSTYICKHNMFLDNTDYYKTS